MMRFSQVTLECHARKPESTNDMTRAFRASDGYALHVEDGMLVVVHVESNKKRMLSATFITDAEPLEVTPATSAAKGKGT